MLDQERLLDYKKLEVRKVSKADEDIIELLKSTILGSEGGMRYTMMNTPERIRSYGDRLSFLALYKRNSLKGVIGLCRRITSNRGTKYPSAYLRYLAVQSAFQVERAPGRRQERHSLAADSFKQKIISLFRNPQQAAGSDENGTGPNIMYAYVESRNERSRNMVNQSGYEYIRSFLTVAFSRFDPKPNPAVTLLAPEEEPAMAALLDEFYSGYCFYTDEFSFHEHKYYVLRHDGEIVAGVGAIPARYRVVNVPGLWGWVMMKLLPRTPLFRRLFQPESFSYVILNAIYCRKGSETLLPDLFEAVCAAEGYHTALTWLDDHSWLYDTLRTNRRMGALNRMLNAKPGLVYALFTGLSPEETEKFYDSPAYISGFDFS
ncbi:MAG: hypothetical protein MUE37_14590 [Bacteroidales bacterium]|jgi:hypothetical protein|nr:hypothetical protein [Bacteroidales bacterium]